MKPIRSKATQALGEFLEKCREALGSPSKAVEAPHDHHGYVSRGHCLSQPRQRWPVEPARTPSLP